MTYTYAIMEVSPAVYEEIKRKLLEAGYDHAVEVDVDGETLDMHGIGLQKQRCFDLPPARSRR